MTTTRYLATALPYSLADDADFHVSVFITHRLEPDGPSATLADFPAADEWVKTVNGAILRLRASNAPAPIPTRTVSAPSTKSWRAAFPSDFPVGGFKTPDDAAAATWESYPANRVGEHALQLQLASTLAAPLGPPGLQHNPALEGFFSTYTRRAPSIRGLLGPWAKERAGRAERIIAQRMQAARTGLGLGGLGRDGPGYQQEAVPTTSAIELLLESYPEEELAFTAYLDDLAAGAPPANPALRAMVDAHATRQFYQRTTPQYAEAPTEPAPPRPDPPTQDFHERAASFGSTPVLLRELGLVVDVAVDSPDDRATLAQANWIAAELNPQASVDAVALAPPRVRCESDGTQFRALSTNAWSAGALPLGDPERYTVLDLDPDASGLKLEQHLRGLPRALASELNGDPASGAPATLRSTGFAIAKVDRADTMRHQVTRAQSFEAVDDADGTGPDLIYDDVVRGVRVEVWDDVSEVWHSLHERIVDVTAGGTRILRNRADVGFLQLTGLTGEPGDQATYYLHQVFAGWDGWSLSAPRPGKIIVHQDGREVVVDEPPDEPAADAVLIGTRVQPGSLPGLRFGQNYSFRVRGVDLAGNSVPIAAPPPAAGDDILKAAERQLDMLNQVYAERDESGLLAAVRGRVLRDLPDDTDRDQTLLDVLGFAGDELSKAQERVAQEAFLATDGPVRVPRAARTGDAEVDGLVNARLGAQRQERRAATASAALARDAVKIAVANLVRSEASLRTRPNLDIEPAAYARIVDRTPSPRLRARRPNVPGVTFPRPTPTSPATAPVVTTPRPHLRWDAVPAPAVVPRREYTPGETAHRIVIRGGDHSERHVAPPKTSQWDAEQHEKFDDAIGSNDPDEHKKLYATALKERGRFLDKRIQHPTDARDTVVQPGIALRSRPGADPATKKTLAQIAANRDTPLGEGQYVIHDTEQLVLPYLPDAAAAGISLTFYDASDPHVLPEPRVLQSVTIDYAGEWPDVEPLRLSVEAGATLGARREGNIVHITVPAGEQVRVALSSSVLEEDLELFGLWRTHVVSQPNADLAARAVLARAAANGWCWWLTPSVDLRLVHAVPRPVRPPEIVALKVWARPPDLPVAALVGVVDLHGPSTERLTIEASWTEWVDDIMAPEPAEIESRDVVTSSPAHPDERFGVLSLIDAVLDQDDGAPPVVLHQTIHKFADTHHRRVSYAAWGVTRYAEFFTPAALPDESDPTLRGNTKDLTIASSARPAAPEVTDVLPLLRWEEGVEPDQPFAYRRHRRSGLRVWLNRPWFSSGDGELLGVILTDGEVEATSTSVWAKDPTLVTGTPASTRELPLVTETELSLQAIAGTVVHEEPDRPVLPAVAVPLVDLPTQPSAMVLAYQPEYHAGRRQWFVDIAIDPGSSLWPFVRLAVARYQPDSIESCELSQVVVTDWAQPLPDRLATISRPADDKVRVTLTGPIAFRPVSTTPEPDDPDEALGQLDDVLRRSREVYATLQFLEAGDARGDLDWEDHGPRVRVPLVAVGDRLMSTWSEELELPDPVELATPGSSEQVRVLLEEIEYFDADPDDGPKEGPPSRTQRVVYLDLLYL